MEMAVRIQRNTHWVLRENEKTRNPPVIILSIRKEDADLLQKMTTGADLYVSKPFDLQELVVEVGQVWRRQAED